MAAQGDSHRIRSLGNWLRGVLFGAGETSAPGTTPRPYLLRKKRLPNTLRSRDWERCLEYWHYQCAICGRPRGLWHTLAQDHWIPLSHPDCPGTTPDNILPLCHGEGGCNNSKGKKDPILWLREKLGSRRANQKLREIESYFALAHEQAQVRLGCPQCGGTVSFDESEALWQCSHCEVAWGDDFARTMANCPTCNCWMLRQTGRGRGVSYACPRCTRTWNESDLSIERCPGCKKGLLEWREEESGYWRCPTCGAEWEDG
ncbi:MAG: hypothetical protein IT322_04195 [Anaerolineae bacterium]|nr:hypothetical protein [Anaerolineae bacterium]